MLKTNGEKYHGICIFNPYMSIIRKGLLVLTALGLVVLLGLFFYPSQIKSKEEVRKEISGEYSKFFSWKGAEIHFTDQGQGDIWVMVHGFGGSHRNFRKLAEQMEKKHRVVRIDLPGFGLSDVPEEYRRSGEYSSMYADIMTFFQDSILKDTVSLMGNSMGGMVSWYYTATRGERVRRLVLIASAGLDMTEISAKATRLMRSGAGSWLQEKGFPYWLAERNARLCYAPEHAPKPEEIRKNWLCWNRTGNLEHAVQLGQNRVFPDTGLLKKIDIPVDIIWGKEDRIIPYHHAERFHALIPNSRMMMLEKCGHVPMAEYPEKVNAFLFDQEK